MSLTSWHRAYCLRLSRPWDRSSLLSGAVEDALAHLPLEAAMLRAGLSEEYGMADPAQAEQVILDGDLELLVVISPSLGIAERAELLDLLQTHFQSCLALASRLSGAEEQAGRARKVQDELRQQLLHSSKMAAMGQMAAGVAHELNSPLGAVMVQLDAIAMNLERERYDKAAAKLSSAAKAAAAAKEIISKLLFYSRDVVSSQALFSLNSVVHDTLGLLGAQLRCDNVEIKLELREIPDVLGNADELQQVVTNLLLNARDAALDPRAHASIIEVHTFRRDASACLEVRDRGPGIRDQDIEKIFTPFFTTKPVGRGTGLGLSISTKIVEQHGGTLTALDRPEGGARFEMMIPRAVSDLPFPQIRQGRPGASEPTSRRGDTGADGRHTVTGG